ncbi:hypothetical protein Salat_0240300 [Sesamum alatum]|uniref:Uncharacterized protein n=1 Tax=Sesamum alatum TaxID=300844 RepID=A0AAE2CYA0_9LAMI|nr:hypothetical protein Salat_0240300 [Sesamum alatum]
MFVGGGTRVGENSGGERGGCRVVGQGSEGEWARLWVGRGDSADWAGLGVHSACGPKYGPISISPTFNKDTVSNVGLTHKEKSGNKEVHSGPLNLELDPTSKSNPFTVVMMGESQLRQIQSGPRGGFLKQFETESFEQNSRNQVWVWKFEVRKRLLISKT